MKGGWSGRADYGSDAYHRSSESRPRAAFLCGQTTGQKFTGSQFEILPKIKHTCFTKPTVQSPSVEKPQNGLVA